MNFLYLLRHENERGVHIFRLPLSQMTPLWLKVFNVVSFSYPFSTVQEKRIYNDNIQPSSTLTGYLLDHAKNESTIKSYMRLRSCRLRLHVNCIPSGRGQTVQIPLPLSYQKVNPLYIHLYNHFWN